MEKRQCICLAYFADGKFIGWYSDSFGSITKDSPKIYGYTEKQLEIITKNFTAKVAKAKGLQEDDFLSATSKIVKQFNPVAGSVMSETISPLSGYDEIELRIVECPIYDGPNPDFNKEEYEKKLEEQRQKMTEEGIFDIPAPSIARFNAVDAFYEKYGKLKRDSWVCADYSKVKEWASNEPSVFLDTIKFKTILK